VIDRSESQLVDRDRINRRRSDTKTPLERRPPQRAARNRAAVARYRDARETR
jgi:hypothetical protein